MERKRTGVETLMHYKNRERRWIEREKRWTEEKGKDTDLETWKEAVTAYLLELARCASGQKTTMSFYQKIRKIGYLKSWEEAFSFYDRKILEEVILEDAVLLYMPELGKNDVNFESLMGRKSPEEIFVAFIEQEMDRRPGLLPGNVILDVLDKLFLLRHDEEAIRDP